ncbi:bifunctional coenzyme A synthase-like, partial [Agrilus planipennis]|uniref:Bifunctional coenzyme A synthase-like n=1 Tax=Agrilus planipennis TaxID=224129 RepID=A0A7F5RBI4_AGRPL
SDPAKLDKLNSLVWPALADEVNELIKSSSTDIVIVEAAILIKAGWEYMCHEIWASIVPPEEAVKRISERNNLTPEQAKQRIDAQPPNKNYVEAANVVFCTLWPEDFTRSQVDKAWNLLKNRLP